MGRKEEINSRVAGSKRNEERMAEMQSLMIPFCLTLIVFHLSHATSAL